MRRSLILLITLPVLAVSLHAQTRAAAAAALPDSARFAGLQWRNIGPWRGGRVTTVTGVLGQPTVYYMGATGGGVWKTDNAGMSWRPISDGQFRMGSIGSIAVAPSDPNVLFVGTGEAPIRGVSSSWGDGVYRSTDAGRTWTNVGLTSARQISKVLIHPANPDVVYVAAQGSRWGRSSERGVYGSVDGGKSWKLLFASVDTLTGPADLAMDPSNPRILYVAMWDHQRTPWKVRSGGPHSGLWKSTDAGVTWTRLENGLPKLMGKVGVAVSAANPDRLWAIVEADEGGLYKSEDAGKSWSLVNSERVLRARSWYYMDVYADPVNPDVVYVLNAPILKSIDAGKSFVELPDPHGDNHDLWINPANPRNLIKGDDGGAAVSVTGGTTWSSINNQGTAQFYRVVTDDRFPYWLYAGQQDNSTVAIPSATDIGSSPYEMMHDVGGGESAHIAFDPANPRYIYATSIQGSISEYDLTTRFVRDVHPYPTLGLGELTSAQKYRFNWSPPVITSPHDRRTLYFGGNVLFKSSDRGQQWTPVSGDLTRNDKSRQGPGGGPITNEGAGGEVYGTIDYIAESPAERGTIWVGTDDGLVQLTRDGGASWNNVTPRDLPESLINMVEVSPQDRGTAYIAVSRHKLNDNTPIAYKTTDYGKSWTRIVTGFREGEPVRVVREDPNRRGLLYAGTETGMYLSFDAGNRWQPFQRNLPAVPVTDLQVKRKDLVIATEGRAFWIMDDVSPLHEMSDSMDKAPVHLVQPRVSYRSSLGGGGDPLAGANNPPGGVIVQYHLAAAPDSASALTLEVLDADGTVVRKFSSEAPKPDVPPGTVRSPKLPASAGLNRFVWNLRREGVAGVPGTMSGETPGYRVVPGTYQLRLSLKGESRTRPLEIVADPRSGFSAEAVRGQQELLSRVYGQLDEVHAASRRLRAVREQVQGLLDRTKDHAAADTLGKIGKALIARVDSLEGQLVNVKNKTFQDVVNFPPGINAQFLTLAQAIDGSDAPVTEGMRTRLADLELLWAPLRDRVERIAKSEVDGFNALVREKSIPAIVVP